MAQRPPKPGSVSTWVPLDGENGAEEVGLGRGWVPEFIGWARHSGNWWVLSCIPFFVLLSAIGGEGEDDGSFPSSIYTLY